MYFTSVIVSALLDQPIENSNIVLIIRISRLWGSSSGRKFSANSSFSWGFTLTRMVLT